jgi:hypothetical protein
LHQTAQSLQYRVTSPMVQTPIPGFMCFTINHAFV